MQFTKFSRTGLTVSRLCLGTGTFGKQTDEAESFRVFDKATDAGVNFIDTADVYPGGADLPEVGRAEEITGLWLKGKRSRFILGTKAGGRMGSSPWDQGSSRKHLLDAIEASLRRLNTDFVGLYQWMTRRHRWMRPLKRLMPSSDRARRAISAFRISWLIDWRGLSASRIR